MTVPFVQLLSANGDGTGATEVTGNYSVTPGVFSIDAAAGFAESTVVQRILVYVRDTGTFDTATYGNGLALANGMTLAVVTAGDAETINLTPSAIKTSGDWAALCYDVSHNNWGTGDEFLTARWTFAKFTSGNGLVLDDGAKLALTANDDMTGLVSHRFTVQGYRTGKSMNY